VDEIVFLSASGPSAFNDQLQPLDQESLFLGQSALTAIDVPFMTR
jgi:hypothetical protein